jgi:hypothetical protein
MTALIFATAITVAANDSLYTPTVAEQVWFCQGTCVVNLSLTKAELSPLAAFEIVAWLRGQGLPIAAIADFGRVERKSVYAWINGGLIKQQNQDRLEKIYNLFSEGQKTELIFLYRFWNRQLSSGESLADLLREETLNVQAIKAALSELWPVAIKAKQMSASDHQINQKKNNPYLEEIGEVIISDEQSS